MTKDNSKLELWQDRLAQADRAYNAELAKMDDREEIYRGSKKLEIPDGVDGFGTKTTHIRNIVFENIESEVSKDIPNPKVTPRRPQDEKLAELIEHMLRNEMDRLPMEVINDMSERTVNIQGGVGFLVDWDHTKRSPERVGEVAIEMIHPKQIAPQPGVYTGFDDMDWFIVKLPTTKAAVKRRYGKDVYSENESEPDVRGLDTDTAEDAVTQYIGYAYNDDGGIDRYSWVNDVELEDLVNYQGRRLPKCSSCGRIRPMRGQVIANSKKPFGDLLPNPERGFAGGLISDDMLLGRAAGMSMAGSIAGTYMSGDEGESLMPGLEYGAGETPEPTKYDGGPCPFCGCEEFTDAEQEYEEIMLPMSNAAGLSIPGAAPGFDPETGSAVMKPTLVPFYRPDVYPMVLQRSVSVFGQLLGNSDVDAIASQQNTINLLEKKIIDRLLKAGTRITLPDRADFRIDAKDGEKWYVGNAADKNLIGTYDFTGNLQYELNYLSIVYEEARQILGITNAYQGRSDSKAVSGKAKQILAQQSAGRLESKRIMKQTAYAKLFEIIFKFWLAYSDEPRKVSYKDSEGKTMYEEFSRYDFLEQDSDGNYWWNDQFLFSVDAASSLATNRSEMWQGTASNFSAGTFGNPNDTATQILYWSKLEELHYPGAGQTKKALEDRLEQEQQAAAAQQQMMIQQQAAAQPAAATNPMQQQSGTATY